MKRIWVATLLLILTLSIGFLALNTTVKTSEDTERLLSQAEEEAYTENWEQVAIKLGEAESLWKDRCKIIKLYTSHERIEAFESELGQMKVALRQSNQMEFLLAASQARGCLHSIHHSEAPNLQNIF